MLKTLIFPQKWVVVWLKNVKLYKFLVNFGLLEVPETDDIMSIWLEYSILAFTLIYNRKMAKCLAVRKKVCNFATLFCANRLENDL